jgi:DNA-directed RNA polymerase subunit RPC12/RpoP
MHGPSLNAVALLAVWESGILKHPIERALLLLAAAFPDEKCDHWEHTSIGERDMRLITLREELFGRSLESVTLCPQCSERIELSFTTTDIRNQGSALSNTNGKLLVETCGYVVQCRLPTSADLLKIAKSATADGPDMLLRQCIVGAHHGGPNVDPDTLPAEVRRSVAEQIAAADPQADVQVEIACPKCRYRWSVMFDILSYFWNEIEDWAQRLLHDVHLLASSYGWSEHDILTMSAQRRQWYLQMIRG